MEGKRALQIGAALLVTGAITGCGSPVEAVTELPASAPPIGEIGPTPTTADIATIFPATPDNAIPGFPYPSDGSGFSRNVGGSPVVNLEQMENDPLLGPEVRLVESKLSETIARMGLNPADFQFIPAVATDPTYSWVIVPQHRETGHFWIPRLQYDPRSIVSGGEPIRFDEPGLLEASLSVYPYNIGLEYAEPFFDLAEVEGPQGFFNLDQLLLHDDTTGFFGIVYKSKTSDNLVGYFDASADTNRDMEGQEILPLPENVRFEFQGQTTEDEQTAIQAATMTYNYYRLMGGEDVGPITFYMYDDRDQLTQAVANHNGWTLAQARNWFVPIARAGHGGAIFVWTGNEQFRGYPRENKAGLFGHEFFHPIQFYLLGATRDISCPQDCGAWWLEGMPTYIANKAIEHYGVYSDYYAATRANLLWESRWISPNETLQNEENYSPGCCIRGWIATEDLVEMTSDGEAALLRFHQYVGQNLGNNWHPSFEQAFGISPLDFYSIEEPRWREQHPHFYHSVVGNLVDDEGNPIEGVWVWACPENPTYECVPFRSVTPQQGNNTGFFVDVPQGDVLLAFSTSPDASTIFGYYRQSTEGPVPTPYPMGDPSYTFPYAAHGSIVVDREEATLINVNSANLAADYAPWYMVHAILPDELLGFVPPGN